MTTARPFDFSKCDGCGEPLAPEARLFGLCRRCDWESRRPVKKPVPGTKPSRDRAT